MSNDLCFFFKVVLIDASRSTVTGENFCLVLIHLILLLVSGLTQGEAFDIQVSHKTVQVINTRSHSVSQISIYDFLELNHSWSLVSGSDTWYLGRLLVGTATS